MNLKGERFGSQSFVVTGIKIVLLGIWLSPAAWCCAPANAAGPATDTSQGRTTAVRAIDFLNSIGVCTHIAQGIDNPTNVADCLRYAGIRNLRDDGSARPATLEGWIHLHQACGAKVCLLPINGNIDRTIFADEQLAAAGALLAVEGPNEPNNFPVRYEGERSSRSNFLPVAKFQRDLYRAVKADPKLAGIPVFASSEAGGAEPNNCGLQFLTIPNGAGTLMPDGVVYADFANTHNYVCDHLTNICDNNAWGAEDPMINGRWDGMHVEYGHTWWPPGYNGYSDSQLMALPKVTTETGWITKGKHAISEEQRGKLFLNLYLAAFKRGWSYTFIYMLRDDPGQGYWGLFYTNYTPKPSAVWLHNLTTILSDDGQLGSFKPGTFDYSIPDQPATVHDLLLQKSDGVFDVAVWGEKANGANEIRLNFGRVDSTVGVYDPTIGISTVSRLSNVLSVPLKLSDHPLILEISRSR